MRIAGTNCHLPLAACVQIVRHAVTDMAPRCQAVAPDSHRSKHFKNRSIGSAGEMPTALSVDACTPARINDCTRDVWWSNLHICRRHLLVRVQ